MANGVVQSMASGDGINATFLAVDVVLPTTLAALSFAGALRVAPAAPVINPATGQATPGAYQTFSGTVTEITPNGTSQQCLLVQVLLASPFTVSSKTGATMPTADPGNLAVFQQTVPASVVASTPPDLQGGIVLTNMW